MFSSQPKPWEPGSFPNLQRFHAFQHVRDLEPAARSIKAAYNQHRVECLKKSGERAASGRWELWSREDDWVGRLEAWEGEVDRQKRARFLKAQLDASERHGRAISAGIAATLAAIRVALEALTPEGMQKLRAMATADGHGLRAALVEARLAAVTLPGLIAAERLVLGMPDGYHVIEERRADLDREKAWVDRALARPKAVDHLIGLLDEMAADDRAAEQASEPSDDPLAGTDESPAPGAVPGEPAAPGSTAPGSVLGTFDDDDGDDDA